MSQVAQAAQPETIIFTEFTENRTPSNLIREFGK
jgi:hypothetical protein